MGNEPVEIEHEKPFNEDCSLDGGYQLSHKLLEISTKMVVKDDKVLFDSEIEQTPSYNVKDSSPIKDKDGSQKQIDPDYIVESVVVHYSANNTVVKKAYLSVDDDNHLTLYVEWEVKWYALTVEE